MILGGEGGWRKPTLHLKTCIAICININKCSMELYFSYFDSLSIPITYSYIHSSLLLILKSRAWKENGYPAEKICLPWDMHLSERKDLCLKKLHEVWSDVEYHISNTFYPGLIFADAISNVRSTAFNCYTFKLALMLNKPQTG